MEKMELGVPVRLCLCMTLALLLTRCVTLGERLSLSVPQVSSCEKNREIMGSLPVWLLQINSCRDAS